MKRFLFLLLASTLQLFALEPIKLEYSPHALERMKERDITKEEIEKAIKYGVSHKDEANDNVIYEHREDPKKLDQFIRVIIKTTKKNTGIVITVYRNYGKGREKEKQQPKPKEPKPKTKQQEQELKQSKQKRRELKQLKRKQRELKQLKLEQQQDEKDEKAEMRRQQELEQQQDKKYEETEMRIQKELQSHEKDENIELKLQNELDRKERRKARQKDLNQYEKYGKIDLLQEERQQKEERKVQQKERQKERNEKWQNTNEALNY